jgi:hypothetical protein
MHADPCQDSLSKTRTDDEYYESYCEYYYEYYCSIIGDSSVL